MTFIIANRADPGEMSNFGAYHLGQGPFVSRSLLWDGRNLKLFFQLPIYQKVLDSTENIP